MTTQSYFKSLLATIQETVHNSAKGLHFTDSILFAHIELYRSYINFHISRLLTFNTRYPQLLKITGDNQLLTMLLAIITGSKHQ